MVLLAENKTHVSSRSMMENGSCITTKSHFSDDFKFFTCQKLEKPSYINSTDSHEKLSTAALTCNIPWLVSCSKNCMYEKLVCVGERLGLWGIIPFTAWISTISTCLCFFFLHVTRELAFEWVIVLWMRISFH